MYYMGFTYSEAYRLPLWQRTWFVERLKKEFEKSSESDAPTPTRAAHLNDPTSRMLMGASRSDAPARVRRFT